jgi:hypothetical protein
MQTLHQLTHPSAPPSALPGEALPGPWIGCFHRGSWIMDPWIDLPSGKHSHSYRKWPFIVGLPIKNGDFPWLCWFTRGYL